MTEQEEFEFRLRYEREQAQGQKPKMPTYDPTEGMSGAQKFFAGVGKAMTDAGRGVGQAFGLVSRDDIAEARRLDQALMNTGAGTAGNIVGNIATLAPTAFIPGVNTVRGAAALGAITGALQPSVSTEETIANTGFGAAGGAAGQKLSQTAGRLLGGNQNANAAATINTSVRGGGAGFGSVDPSDIGSLSAGQQKIMQWGRDNGFTLTPGQASGSRALQQIEAKLESQPMTSGTFNRIKDSNQAQLNRFAGKAIGENTDNLSSDVLEAAKDRISGVYKMVADDRARKIDPDQFLGRLAQIEDDFSGLIYSSDGKAISPLDNPLIKRMFSYAESGKATGKQLQDLASRLGKAGADQMTTQSGNRQLGMAMFQAKDLADDLLEQGLTGQTAKMFSDARGQYRNLMLLTSRQGVVNPASGNVSGGALASALQGKDKAGYLFNKNQGDLYNAARFAQAFKPIVGDSGTATRSMINNPLDFVTQVPINLATRAYASSPMVSIAASVGKGAAPDTFTPGLLRLMNDASRTTGMGLLNSAE